MNQNNRKCTNIGHDDNDVTHFCSVSNCQHSRWACSECLAEDIHRHGFDKNSHLKNKKQFHDYMINILGEAQSKSLQQSSYILQHVKIIIQGLQNLTEVLQDLTNEFQQIIKDYSGQDLKNDFSNLEKKVKEKLFNMNLEEINQVFKIKQIDQKLYIDLNLIQYQLDQCPIIYNQIMEQFLLMQQHYLRMNSDIVNYDNQEIKLERIACRYIYKIVISPDENKMVQLSNNFIDCYIIHNFQIKRQKQITNDYDRGPQSLIFQVCEFSQDSQKLFAGCKYGQLIIFDNQFQQIKDIQCGFCNLSQISNISNEILLISSEYGNILKLNIKNSQTLFNIECCGSQLVYHKQNDIIISIYQTNMFFWNGKQGDLLFTKDDSNKNRYFNSIQLIKKEQQLLTLNDQGEIKIWLIKWQKNDLVLLNQYQDLQNKIQIAYQMNDKKIMVLKKMLNREILNQKFDTLQKFQIQQDPIFNVNYCHSYAVSNSIIAFYQDTYHGQILFMAQEL